MDDTFVIHKEANKQGFLQHINSVDPAIMFTVEDNKEDGSVPFLDTIVKPEADVVEAWFSLEQYIGLKEDKLSSNTVDFIGSEGNLKTKCLYWFRKPKMC